MMVAQVLLMAPPICAPGQEAIGLLYSRLSLVGVGGGRPGRPSPRSIWQQLFTDEDTVPEAERDIHGRGWQFIPPVSTWME